MALELHFEEQIAETAFDEHGSSTTPLEKWNTFDEESEENVPRGFDCNICLDLVHDPVVTFCGHLYCWRCIYKWIQLRSYHQHPQCPVCKAEVSYNTLIPLYGPDQDNTKSTKPSEYDVPCKGMIIPRRRLRSRRGDHTLVETVDSHPSQQNPRSYHMLHPMIGEMVYARVFGNSSPTMYTNPRSYNLAGRNSWRMRRQLLHADKSLGRIYFFLFCCVVACLLLF